MKQINQTTLIIGGGYLGKRLADQQVEQRCYFTKRVLPQNKQVDTPYSQALVLDINQIDTWSNLDLFQDQTPVVVYCLVPPSKIDESSFEKFIHYLTSLPIARAIMTSSTVVYGTLQREVSAESEVLLDTVRARKQYALERIWCALGDRAYILRLAGLYGPGRVIGERVLTECKALNSNPDATLNLIHVDDAVSVLMKLAESERANTIELACDDQPVVRREYYQYLATLFDLPEPIFNNLENWSGANRFCNNSTTCDRILWQPKFKHYRDGLQDCLEHRHASSD